MMIEEEGILNIREREKVKLVCLLSTAGSLVDCWLTVDWLHASCWLFAACCWLAG